jgi:hypothetical protein
MQDVMLKLVNVFAAKDLLETQIYSACHLLDPLYALQGVDKTVIVNMAGQTTVFVILDIQVIHTLDVIVRNTKHVLT